MTLRDANVLSEVNSSSINWNIRDELKGQTLEDINRHQIKFPYAVAMLNTSGSLNIGVAMRSAVIFGASKFYIAGKRQYDRRSTVGAQNYIDIERIACYDDVTGELDSNVLIDAIVSDGYTPCIIEQDYPDINLIADDEPKYPCFIFGEEQKGVPDVFMKYPGYSIKQYGVLRSLNVSVAVGITLHHVAHYFEKGL